MVLKILRNDLKRNKLITISLFIFVFLASFLTSTGLYVFMQLNGSLDSFFSKARMADFVQMHAGDIQPEQFVSFDRQNEAVEEKQIQAMLGFDWRNVSFGEKDYLESHSVMDLLFVTQNERFDFLLDLQNEYAQVQTGEIGVPLYFMKLHDLKIGDKVEINKGDFQFSFIIGTFIRDAEMNPDVVSSKRFLISQTDFEQLKDVADSKEYLIEYRLKNPEQVDDFTTTYQNAMMPGRGPTINGSLFRMMNAMTDGVVIAIMMAITVLLIIIALLCLRFTLLATIEEDYREIGVMKAIGICQRDIKRFYLIKYLVVSLFSAAFGCIAAQLAGKSFTGHIILYMGDSPETLLKTVIPCIGSVAVALLVILFCWLILSRFKKISAVQALRSGAVIKRKVTGGVRLEQIKFLDTNLFMGLNDFSGKFGILLLLIFIYMICTFIVSVPLNLLNTIQSDSFITYMGVGESDIRIDIHDRGNMGEEFDGIVSRLRADDEIQRVSPSITYRYKVLNSEETYDNINVESGDFSVFPLAYLKGHTPLETDEIALSYLQAQNLEKEVGDSVTLLVEGGRQDLIVSGIYQDITNGGLTAKGHLSGNRETALWYTVALSLKPGVSVRDKTAELNAQIDYAKVTPVKEYVNQTFGATIQQVRTVTLFTCGIALFLTLLITAFFMKMLMAKDGPQIAVMRSIGFSPTDIRIQNFARNSLVLLISIFLGTILSNTLGERMVNLMTAGLGASDIHFKIDYIRSFVFMPVIFFSVVLLTTYISSLQLKKKTIKELIME
ncbi:MAG TPA: ABC transporter permease [Thermotogota bacterium]|nr:ABC transporter permease [Thermotogota bacterium]HPJ88968.1 ABC transporter permease [Thermotogota bacterium]HPR95894.1 ABC transporter permease [Thermotogota bacterium]